MKQSMWDIDRYVELQIDNCNYPRPPINQSPHRHFCLIKWAYMDAWLIQQQQQW